VLARCIGSGGPPVIEHVSEIAFLIAVAVSDFKVWISFKCCMTEFWLSVRRQSRSREPHAVFPKVNAQIMA
jgi:hypothetical protein